MKPITEAGNAVKAMLSATLGEKEIIKAFEALDPLKLSGEELADAARAMLTFAKPFPTVPNILDTCGTGGDGASTLNISTACAFVLAACGVCVVKHGNRAVSSKSGSADVLAALGINIHPSAEGISRALHEVGLGFIFAPDYHPKLAAIADARKAYGKRTLFNVLGPLCNPARPRRQVVGVFDAALLVPVAEALYIMGSREAMVVHAHDGLDEISISAPTDIVHLKHGEFDQFTLHPHDAGIMLHAKDALIGGDAALNADALLKLLAGEASAYHESVALNAAAGLMIAGKAPHWQEGLAIARAAIISGKALGVFDKYRKITA